MSFYCGGVEGQIVMYPNNNIPTYRALPAPPYAVSIEGVDSLKTLHLSSLLLDWRNLVTKYKNGPSLNCSYLDVCSLGCLYTSILSRDSAGPVTLICHIFKRVMKETGRGNG